VNPLTIALMGYASLLVFYVLYIAAVNIYRDWDTLAGWLQAVLFFPMALFVIFDIVANLIAATVVFWDFPREAMVTQRLARYRGDAWPAGRRKTVATVLCTQALNPFDPTKKHC
jgi:hypothetical protein